MEFNIILKFFLAIALGGLIGIEREMVFIETGNRKLAGIRTFMFSSLLGAVSAFISMNYLNWFFIPVFVIFAMTILIGYIFNYLKYKKFGLTTVISALLAFLLGLLPIFDFQREAIALTVIIVFLLSFKRNLQAILLKITPNELFNSLKFALITLVILPFLPNKSFGPYEVLNPYHIWLMVVFVSAISFSGYIAIKFLGSKKGIGLTGFLGGLVSSTATTSSLSSESKRYPKYINSYIFAVLVANATSYFRVLFEIIVLNRGLISKVALPMIAMGIISFLFAIYFWRMKSLSVVKNEQVKSPFRILPALGFGMFFTFILLVSKLSQVYFGSVGIYFTSIISGLADIDAITISMAKLANSSTVTNVVATNAITMAVISNTVVKFIIIGLFAHPKMLGRISFSFVCIIGVGLITILI